MSISGIQGCGIGQLIHRLTGATAGICSLRGPDRGLAPRARGSRSGRIGYRRPAPPGTRVPRT